MWQVSTLQQNGYLSKETRVCLVSHTTSRGTTIYRIATTTNSIATAWHLATAVTEAVIRMLLAVKHTGRSQAISSGPSNHSLPPKAQKSVRLTMYMYPDMKQGRVKTLHMYCQKRMHDISCSLFWWMVTTVCNSIT